MIGQIDCHSRLTPKSALNGIIVGIAVFFTACSNNLRLVPPCCGGPNCRRGSRCFFGMESTNTATGETCSRASTIRKNPWLGPNTSSIAIRAGPVQSASGAADFASAGSFLTASPITSRLKRTGVEQQLVGGKSVERPSLQEALDLLRAFDQIVEVEQPVTRHRPDPFPRSAGPGV